jgi:hypothetical protein
MSNMEDMLKKYNAGLKYYMIMPCDKVVGEDGKYIEGDFVGYGIENKVTGVTEHTSTCMPAAMFQANHFDDMLASLLDGKPPALSLVDISEDIVPGPSH